jgi:hypothetical protein
MPEHLSLPQSHAPHRSVYYLHCKKKKQKQEEEKLRQNIVTRDIA